MNYDFKSMHERIGISQHNIPTSDELWKQGASVEIYGGVDCLWTIDALWGKDGHLWGNLRGGIIRIGGLTTGVVWKSSEERQRQHEQIRRDIARQSVEKLKSQHRVNFAKQLGYTLEQLDLQYSQENLL